MQIRILLIAFTLALFACNNSRKPIYNTEELKLMKPGDTIYISVRTNVDYVELGTVTHNDTLHEVISFQTNSRYPNSARYEEITSN